MFLLVVSCLSSCGDDPYSLRSSDAEFYYSINNKQAADRFASVMYNQADTANPVERFKFVHISDAHVSDWAADNYYTYPNNLVEAVTFANQGELRMNALVATGDHISGAKKSEASKYMNSFFSHLYTNNGVPTFPCYGNHDTNMTDQSTAQYLSSAELATAFNNKGNYPLKRPSGKNYYYADVANPMGGMIRFIALDMTDQPDNMYNTLIYAIYSQEQVDWFGNVALKEGMTDRHSVVVLTHYPFQPRETDGSTFLIDGNFMYTYLLFPEIVEAFRSKSSIKKTYGNILAPDKKLFVDFDFSASPGDFICHLGGHAHVFATFDIERLGNANTGLLPQRMILCTNMAPANAGVFFNRVYRKDSSISSNSFNLYAIDTRERKIFITFFGAYKPSDDSNFSEHIELTY